MIIRASPPISQRKLISPVAVGQVYSALAFFEDRYTDFGAITLDLVLGFWLTFLVFAGILEMQVQIPDSQQRQAFRRF